MRAQDFVYFVPHQPNRCLDTQHLSDGGMNKWLLCAWYDRGAVIGARGCTRAAEHSAWRRLEKGVWFWCQPYKTGWGRHQLGILCCKQQKLTWLRLKVIYWKGSRAPQIDKRPEEQPGTWKKRQQPWRPGTRDHDLCTSQGLGAQEAAVGRNATVFNFFVSLHEN